MATSTNYATKKYRRRGRICWASRLPRPNPRLESAVETSRGEFFSASVVMILPGGEIRVAEVSERGRRLVVHGRGGEVKVAAGVFWNLADAMRKADGR